VCDFFLCVVLCVGVISVFVDLYFFVCACVFGACLCCDWCVCGVCVL